MQWLFYFGIMNKEKLYVAIKKINRQYIQDNYDNLLNNLHPTRKLSVERFNNFEAKCVGITAGYLLQNVYEKTTGLDRKNISIATGNNGKPYIENSKFIYNLSHSKDYVVLVYYFGDEAINLGIDIEPIREHKNDRKVADRFFTEEERQYIFGEADSKSANEKFFEIWTMKESYLKMKGTGISVGLDSFSVNPLSLACNQKDCWFENIRYDGYIISVCADKIFELDVESNL